MALQSKGARFISPGKNPVSENIQVNLFEPPAAPHGSIDLLQPPVPPKRTNRELDLCAQLLLGASLALLLARRQLLAISSETYEGGRERRAVWSGRPIQNETLTKSVSRQFVHSFLSKIFAKK